ncbi:hypothetical protein G6F22_021585 [Rhizopus arrhizus]|nr:hypothetical protein G6F22_021585 [Rhizopus arrhizus]
MRTIRWKTWASRWAWRSPRPSAPRPACAATATPTCRWTKRCRASWWTSRAAPAWNTTSRSRAPTLAISM